VIRSPGATGTVSTNFVEGPPTRVWKGSELEQWEYEITSGGRVRYLVSLETSTVILVYASPRHPKVTE
jgi:hypothetical protein